MAEGGHSSQQQKSDGPRENDPDLSTDATAEQPESKRPTQTSSHRSNIGSSHAASVNSPDYHSKCPKDKGCQLYNYDVVIFSCEINRKASYSVKKWIDDNIRTLHQGKEYGLKTVMLPDVHSSPVFESFEKACEKAKIIVVIVTKESVADPTMNLMNYTLWTEKAKTGVEIIPILVGYSDDQELPKDFTLNNAFFIRFEPDEDHFKYAMQRLTKFFQTRLEHDEIRRQCAMQTCQNLKLGGDEHLMDNFSVDGRSARTLGVSSYEEQSVSTYLTDGLSPLPASDHYKSEQDQWTSFPEQEEQPEEKERTEDGIGTYNVREAIQSAAPFEADGARSEVISSSESNAYVAGILRETALDPTGISKMHCLLAGSSGQDGTVRCPDSGLGESYGGPKIEHPSSTAAQSSETLPGPGQIITNVTRLERRGEESKGKAHEIPPKSPQSEKKVESGHEYSKLDTGCNAHSGFQMLEKPGRTDDAKDPQVPRDGTGTDMRVSCSADMSALDAVKPQTEEEPMVQETIEERDKSEFESCKEEKNATKPERTSSVSGQENSQVSNAAAVDHHEQPVIPFDADERQPDAAAHAEPPDTTAQTQESKAGTASTKADETQPLSGLCIDQIRQDMAIDSEVYHGEIETFEHSEEGVEAERQSVQPEPKENNYKDYCETEEPTSCSLDSITDLKLRHQSGGDIYPDKMNTDRKPSAWKNGTVTEPGNLEPSATDPVRLCSTSSMNTFFEGVMPDTQFAEESVTYEDGSITEKINTQAMGSADSTTELSEHPSDYDTLDERSNSDETQPKQALTTHPPEKTPVQESSALEATEPPNDDSGERKETASSNGTTMYQDKQSSAYMTNTTGDLGVLQQGKQKITTAPQSKVDPVESRRAEVVPYDNSNEGQHTEEHSDSSSALEQTEYSKSVQNTIRAEAHVRNMSPVIHIHTAGSFVLTSNYTVNHAHEEHFNTNTSNSNKLTNNTSFHGGEQRQDSDPTQRPEAALDRDVQNSARRRGDASTCNEAVTAQAEPEDDSKTSWWSWLCDIL